MKHYRAIIFVAALPGFLRKDTSLDHNIGHGSSPEASYAERRADVVSERRT